MWFHLGKWFQASEEDWRVQSHDSPQFGAVQYTPSTVHASEETLKAIEDDWLYAYISNRITSLFPFPNLPPPSKKKAIISPFNIFISDSKIWNTANARKVHQSGRTFNLNYNAGLHTQHRWPLTADDIFKGGYKSHLLY